MFGINREEGKKTATKDEACELRHSIFHTMGMMKYSLGRLEQEKSRFITEARELMSKSDDQAYRLCKKRLSLCLVNIRLITEMLSSLEISLQLDNMDRMVESYRSCMEAFGKQHSMVNASRGVAKNNKILNDGLGSAIEFYNSLYNGLSLKESDAADKSTGGVPDNELDKIIELEIGRDDEENKALDARIQQIRSKIKEA